MAQVKFYSKSALPSENLDQNGVYFIDNGELYKGAQRFGRGRVTIANSTASIEGAVRGDIVVTGQGAGWVYDGSAWQSIGGDVGSLTSQWRADISTWTAGLVSTAQTDGTYIKQITQAEDGKVSAKVSNFATDVLTAVGDGDASSTANGITVSVTTTSGSVTAVSVSASQISCDTVTASSATFTDLTVTSTATFSATEVSAGTLTVGGTAVDNVSAASASDSDAGIAVTVSTLGGGVSAIDVTVTSATLLNTLALSALSGKGVATEIRANGTATDAGLATEKAVRDALNAFDNAMHFRGVFASPDDCTNPQGGDIIIIGGASQGSEYVDGQEWIYNDKSTALFKWEKIGDQSAVTGGTSTSTVHNAISVTVVTAAATAAPSVTLTGVGTAAVKDYADAVTADATTLPTCSAVASYVSTQLSYTPGSETVTSQATTLTAAMHSVAGAVDTLNTNIATKASVGNSTSTDAGITGAITLSANAEPSITMTVDTNALKTSLGLKTAAYVDTATTVTSEGTNLPTQSAVYSFVTDLISGLTSTVSGSDGNVSVTVEQTNGKLTACTVAFEWL